MDAMGLQNILANLYSEVMTIYLENLTTLPHGVEMSQFFLHFLEDFYLIRKNSN